MKKLKILSFLSFIFGIMFFTNIAPVKADDLHLFSYEEVYGFNNHYYSFVDNDRPEWSNFKYGINLNMKMENDEIFYFSFNSLNDNNSLIFKNNDNYHCYIMIDILDVERNVSGYISIDPDDKGVLNNNEFSFDTDDESYPLELIDYGFEVENSFKKVSYNAEEDFNNNDQLITEHEFDKLGELYSFNLNQLGTKGDIIINSITINYYSLPNIVMHNWNEMAWYSSNVLLFDNIYENYFSFDVLINRPLENLNTKVSKVYNDNNKLMIDFENVFDIRPKKVKIKITAKESIFTKIFELFNIKNTNVFEKEFNLTEISTENNIVSYKVDELSLSSLENATYCIYNYTFVDSNDNEYSVSDNRTVQYNTVKSTHQVYIPTLAQRYYTGIFGIRNYHSVIFFNLYDLDTNEKITNLDKVFLKYNYDNFGKVVNKEYTWYTSTPANSVDVYDGSKFSKDGLVYKSNDEKGFKVDFQTTENNTWDKLLKNWADAHSYSYWNYCYGTSLKIHENDNYKLEYDLALATYYTKEGELTQGSAFENALWIDDNGKVLDAIGNEMSGYSFNGYNIIDPEGNIIEPTSQSKLRTATSVDDPSNLFATAFDDGVLDKDNDDSLISKILKFIDEIKGFFNNLGIGFKIVITASVSLFLFFIIYKVAKLIVKVFKK